MYLVRKANYSSLRRGGIGKDLEVQYVCDHYGDARNLKMRLNLLLHRTRVNAHQ